MTTTTITRYKNGKPVRQVVVEPAKTVTAGYSYTVYVYAPRGEDS